ncbi:toll-like receptor 6 [Haliotis rubra]|uniref:toll-like receptor 6 n=1 Tax=Haliotis rubra TaxID=36100 RepID=UPI001EE5CFAD|nr:toll-like receptor 6 [Haliotis rubra]
MAAHPHKRTQRDSYVFCQLDAVYRDMLQPLTNLEVLDLAHNHLFRIPPHCFDDMTKMKLLSLSNNQIEHFFDGLLCDVSSLEVLLLQDLPLTSFPANLFECGSDFQSSLKIIDISHSKISTLKKGDFQSLKHLGLLDLSYNNLDTLPEEPFLGLSSLQTLDMSGNSFIELPTTLCVGDLFNLQELHLQGNAISYIAPHWFINMTELQIIDMSKNKLSIISDGLFSTLPKLEELSLKGNGLTIDSAKDLFHESRLMRRLDLSENNIRNIDNLLDGTSMRHVEHLDLSFNNISAIRAPLNKRNESVSLKWLNLESCGIESVVRDAFVHMEVLEYVKLVNNSITFVPLFDARLGAMFFFRGNPIICSCGMVWLEERWLDTDTVDKMSTYDYDVDVCRTYPSMMVKPIRHLSDREFMCPVPSNCPPECDCFVLKEGGSVYITVCRNNLTDIPQNLPHDSEYLYLDGNNFHTVQRISKGFHYTENVFLNNSGVVSFGEDVFKDFSHVFVIDISFNDLKSLPTSIFQGLKYLKDINLKHNHLTHISEGLLKNVPHSKT